MPMATHVNPLLLQLGVHVAGVRAFVLRPRATTAVCTASDVNLKNTYHS